MLTLYTTPVVYLYFDRLAKRLQPASRRQLCGGRAARRGSAVSISAGFIKRPVGTSLLTVGLALAGMVAYRLLPVAPLPEVEFPTINVYAGLPGASPETMASAVATPLERQFGRIAGVTEMTSTSGLGSTNITLQFDLNRNIDAAARDVQAAINAARGQLPPNLPNNPTYRKVNPADAPILILALTSDSYDTAQMYDAADSILAQKLSQVEGVGQVVVGGGAKPAVRVELNPRALESFQIGLDQVRTTLSNANAHSPTGASAPASAAGRLRPPTSFSKRPITASWSSAITTAAPSSFPTWRPWPIPCRTAATPASPTASRPCSSFSSASPPPT